MLYDGVLLPNNPPDRLPLPLLLSPAISQIRMPSYAASDIGGDEFYKCRPFSWLLFTGSAGLECMRAVRGPLIEDRDEISSELQSHWR